MTGDIVDCVYQLLSEGKLENNSFASLIYLELHGETGLQITLLEHKWAKCLFSFSHLVANMQSPSFCFCSVSVQ